jgi:uncharacterized protein DUF72
MSFCSHGKQLGARTPEDFLFSVKIPQVITHEKALVDCDSEFEEFVKTMDILGPKLGPMVFQFPLFDRWKFPKQDRPLTHDMCSRPASYNGIVLSPASNPLIVLRYSISLLMVF